MGFNSGFKGLMKHVNFFLVVAYTIRTVLWWSYLYASNMWTEMGVDIEDYICWYVNLLLLLSCGLTKLNNSVPSANTRLRLSEDEADALKHVAVLNDIYIYIYVVNLLVWIINCTQCTVHTSKSLSTNPSTCYFIRYTCFNNYFCHCNINNSSFQITVIFRTDRNLYKKNCNYFATTQRDTVEIDSVILLIKHFSHILTAY